MGKIEADIARRLEIERHNCWDRSGVSPLHREHASQCQQASRWKSVFDGLAKQMGKGLMIALVGPPGTGKTQMAAMLLKQKIWQMNIQENGHFPIVSFISASRLFLNLRSQMNIKGGSEKETLDVYAKTNTLVIDDLQRRGDTDYERIMLETILNERYEWNRDTILISNHDVQKFTACIGDAMASRFREKGGIVKCDWPSYRDRR